MKTKDLIRELQELDPGGELDCVTLNFEHGVYDDILHPEVFPAVDIMGVLKTTPNVLSLLKVIVL